ncbi:hypothetical protein H6H03_19880 [Nostoc paludosum FACHB-159]|uniref:Uncharacterized protein n=1 Tax=Nostoc paludosum FACHB-159 TaxID=2692908 RepID=A0ABR8K9F2_9NOSO|nr:hypothetical protein [Nostoc paludosum FACHB-159]
MSPIHTKTFLEGTLQQKSNIPYEYRESANARLNQGQDLHKVYRISLYSSIAFCV